MELLYEDLLTNTMSGPIYSTPYYRQQPASLLRLKFRIIERLISRVASQILRVRFRAMFTSGVFTIQWQVYRSSCVRFQTWFGIASSFSLLKQPFVSSFCHIYGRDTQSKLGETRCRPLLLIPLHESLECPIRRRIGRWWSPAPPFPKKIFHY